MTVLTENVNPRNPPHRETQIPQCLAVQIQIEFEFGYVFVPRNLSFLIWGISGFSFFSGDCYRRATG